MFVIDLCAFQAHLNFMSFHLYNSIFPGSFSSEDQLILILRLHHMFQECTLGLHRWDKIAEQKN